MKNMISRSALAFLFIGSVAQARHIPLPASDDVWAAAKQRVTLSTGIRMKFVEAGNTSGPVAIFLHGYTDSSRDFFPMLQTLIKLRPDLHFYSLDLRGHGASSMPSGPQCPNQPDLCFRLDDFTADVLAFMNSAGINKAHLIGFSLGSFVAANVASTRPKRVSRLVLISTTPSVTPNTALNFIDAQINGPWKTALTSRGVLWPSGAYKVPPIEADPFSAPCPCPGPPCPCDRDLGALPWIYLNWEIEPMVSPTFAGFMTLEAARTPLGTWLGVGGNNFTPQLLKLAVPTLILWGTQDAIFPDSDQQNLRNTLAQAPGLCSQGRRYYHKTYGKLPLPPSRLQESDVGHLIPWDAPAELAKDLAAYLRPNGKPTPDLYYADPNNFRKVLTDPGKATIVTCP